MEPSARGLRRAEGGPAHGVIEWRAQPWRRFGAPIAAVIALFAALLAYAALVARDGLLTGLAAAAMFYVLAPLLVPVRFRLDDEGVARSSPFARRRWAWSEFRDWRADPAGRACFLRYAGRGLARFRSTLALFLPDSETQAAVERRLEDRLGPVRER